MSDTPNTRFGGPPSDLAGATSVNPLPAAAGRPAVLSLAIREKAALYAAYMPYLKNGGIFVPTNRPYKLGDEVYLILTLMDDPTKYAVAGRVVWISPPGGTARMPGIGVHFPGDETGIAVRRSIEDLLGAALKSGRPTHTI
jgi:type IV pilus assembly protein PilZ